MADILLNILYVLVGLVFITLLVVAHESGHFFVGKKCGIGIIEFSAGMGPKIVSKVRNGIRYSLRALPIGGFVQFVGEDEDTPNDPTAFNNRPAWQRFLTLLAGPMMNLIVAFLITVVVLLGFGDNALSIATVETGLPAYEAGLQEGDRIAEVNGKTLDFYSEYAFYSESGVNVFDSQDGSIALTVERDGELIDYVLQKELAPDGTERIGITLGISGRSFSFFEAITLSFKWMFLLVVEMIKFLGALVTTGKGASDMMGAVGTASYMGQVVALGSGEIILKLVSLVSINLAVVNLLPLPALDGGRIVFLGLEKLSGNRIPKKVEGVVNLVGIVLLFGLMILLTVQDFSRGFNFF